MSDEAGASDNRLSLNPSQFPITEDWQDGQTYTVTLKVEQVSPGEFEVLSADSPGAEKPAEPGMTEQPEGEPVEEEKEAAGPPNPAVRRMMQGIGRRNAGSRGSY